MDHGELAPVGERREVGEIDQDAISGPEGQDGLFPELVMTKPLFDFADMVQRRGPVRPSRQEQAEVQPLVRGAQRIEFTDQAIGGAMPPVQNPAVELAVQVDFRFRGSVPEDGGSTRATAATIGGLLRDRAERGAAADHELIMHSIAPISTSGIRVFFDSLTAFTIADVKRV